MENAFYLLRGGETPFRYKTMKTISISNTLYGLLWAHSVESDKSEEDILRRLLTLHHKSAAIQPTIQAPMESTPGFTDSRSGTVFPQGFKIFRTYKGKRYSATASQGKWDLEGHLIAYGSLSALSAAVGAKTENAWLGWKFERDGVARLINELRDPASIQQRG